MARVTVEDCIEHVPNRFELVLLASQRAKQISAGNPLTIDRDNDKDSVVSLREIADRTVSLEDLEENLVQSYFKRPLSDINDKKLLTSNDETATLSDEELKEVFAEASRNIANQTDEDLIEGMSFDGEDVAGDD